MIKFDNVNNVRAFKAKLEEEVIKVRDCTFSNDVKDEKRKYYFCSCFNTVCAPICEACAKTCHKEHEPSVCVEGIYECKCGVQNHFKSEENETYYNSIKRELKRKCFYFEFFKYTINFGFFRENRTGVILCAICRDFCLGSKDNKANYSPYKQGKGDIFCKCEKHYEENILNINQDLLKEGIKFQDYILNFNFNLISVVSSSKKIYIMFLKGKLAGMKDKLNLEEDQKKDEINNFYKDFFLSNVFNLYDVFSMKYQKKFLVLRDVIESEIQIVENLIKEPFINPPESDVSDICLNRMLFLELLFFNYIKQYIVRNNNMFSLYSILNMNVFQRELYMIDTVYFAKHYLSSEEYEKLEFFHLFIKNYPSIVLETYENILKQNENTDIFETISNSIFGIFNRTFKTLIKYNLLDDDNKNKYFELVSDTILLYNDHERKDFSGAYYIMKSILYSLIYKNDKICTTRMRNEDFLNDKDKIFSFVASEDNNTISKVFVSIITRFDRENNSWQRILKYDYFVQKIFDLLIGKHTMYIDSLENMVKLSDDTLDNGIDPYRIPDVIKSDLLNQVLEISQNIRSQTKKYYAFESNFKVFIDNMNESILNLKEILSKKLVNNLPKLERKHQVYPEFVAFENPDIKKYKILLNIRI